MNRHRLDSYEVIDRVDHDSGVLLARALNEEGRLVTLEALGRDVAATVLARAARAREVTNDTVVQVVDLIEDDGAITLVKEHVDGMTLEQIMRYASTRGEHLGDGAVFHVAHVLLQALEQAHAVRSADEPPFAHGGIAPDVVRIAWDGRVKLDGFAEGCVWHDLRGYQAPEVLLGADVTPRADVFSVGALLWTLLTRRPAPAYPVARRSLSSLRRDLPKEVSRAIDTALDNDPRLRPTARALRRSLADSGVAPDPDDLRWAMEVYRVRCAVESDVPAMPEQRATERDTVLDIEDEMPTTAPPAPTSRPIVSGMVERSESEDPRSWRAPAIMPPAPRPPSVKPPRWPPYATVAMAIGGALCFTAGLVAAEGGLAMCMPADEHAVLTPANEPAWTMGALAPTVQRSASSAHGSAPSTRSAASAPSFTPAVPPPHPASASSAELPPGKGLLIVNAAHPGAAVYVQGTHVGTVGTPHEVDCGVRWVRLGTEPLRGWLTEGRAVEVACGAVTTVDGGPK